MHYLKHNCKDKLSQISQYYKEIADFHIQSTQEAAEINLELYEARIPQQIVNLIVSNIPKGSTIYLQDLRLYQQVTDMGYIPQSNIEMFRQIRHAETQKQLGGSNNSDSVQNNQHSIALAHQLSRIICQCDDAKSDQQIIQAINLYELTVKDINIQFMRQAEIQGFSFPEFSRIIKDQELYIIICKYFKNRQFIVSQDFQNNEQKLQEMTQTVINDCNRLFIGGIQSSSLSKTQITNQIKKLCDAALLSTGTDLPEIDLQFMNDVNDKLYDLLEQKKQTFQFIESTLETLSPNLLQLMGPLPTARLIEKAGSLSKLAKSPSSTVQLFGAEKALFRVLKRHGTKTPKYGLIFNSEQVQSVKTVKTKGRVARALACCASRCSRIDYYSRQNENKDYGLKMHQLMEHRIRFYEGKEKKMLRTCDIQTE